MAPRNRDSINRGYNLLRRLGFSPPESRRLNTLGRLRVYRDYVQRFDEYGYLDEYPTGAESVLAQARILAIRGGRLNQAAITDEEFRSTRHVNAARDLYFENRLDLIQRPGYVMSADFLENVNMDRLNAIDRLTSEYGFTEGRIRALRDITAVNFEQIEDSEERRRMNRGSR